MAHDVWRNPAEHKGCASFDAFFAYFQAIGYDPDIVAEVHTRCGSVRRATAALLPDPTGFPRVFERYRGSLRPGAATTRTMKDLQTVMTCRNGQKVVRHAEIVTAHLLQITATLPPALRHTSIVTQLASRTEALLLKRIHSIYAARDEGSARKFAMELQRSEGRGRLFGYSGRAIDNLQRHYPRLERAARRWILVRTLLEVEAAGALFDNCLKEPRWRDSYAKNIASGDCIVMMRPSPTTPLIADIRPSLIGEARVAQLCGVRNAPQPPEAIAEAAAELAEFGFHSKPPGAPLHSDPLELLVAGVGVLEGRRAERRAALCLRALDGAPVRLADVRISEDAWIDSAFAEFRGRDQ